MGIIVGAMALFVVLSVFSGLKVFSLSFTNEIDPDLKISSTLGNLLISQNKKEIKDIAGIASYTKIIEEACFIHF
jgi:lipoprotein-releasing system permease protein